MVNISNTHFELRFLELYYLVKEFKKNVFTQYKTEFYIDIYLFKHKKDLVRVKATKLDI